MNTFTPVEEMTQFLDTVSQQGFLKQNTAASRKTACSKLFEVLEENQRSVEYVKENLDVMRRKFLNLHPDVQGTTVDEYIRRINLVLADFLAWKEDRGAWEKSCGSKPARDRQPEKKESSRKEAKQESTPSEEVKQVEKLRKLAFPVGAEEDVIVMIPTTFTKDQLRRLGYFLLPYCSDFFEGPGAAPEWPPLPMQR